MPRASAALLAALLLTALNAAKPLVIDDPVYVAFARQIAEHPSDPYGFTFDWLDRPEPAISFGWAPPVLTHWLAGAMTLFGSSPVAWKLSLLPFALALTGSLAFLLGRWAGEHTNAVLFAAVLGPTLLPSLNLMLDVPALALGLLGYALFVRACERTSLALALAAGVTLGLAMQTKYTAVSFPLLVLAHAAIFRRPREAAVALLAAAGLFVGWEAHLVARYGQSHFVTGLGWTSRLHLLAGVAQENARVPGTAALYWILCLVSLTGATLLFPGLLAFVGLGARMRTLAVAALVAGLGFAAIPLLPQTPLFEADPFFASLVAWNPTLLLFLPCGLAVFGACGALAVRSFRRSQAAADAQDLRIDRVLLVWLLLEITSYFAISPFPAVRRLLGLGVAMTLLAARAVAKRRDVLEARAAVRVAAGFGVALGMLYFAADLADASGRHAAIERAAQRLTQLGADPSRETLWYTGHWELQFYAQQAGLRAIVPGESHLRPRDWLLLPEGMAKPPLSFPSSHFEQEDELLATSASPWSTIPLYYDGPVPLRPQPASQALLRIFRVTRDWVPQRRSE